MVRGRRKRYMLFCRVATCADKERRCLNTSSHAATDSAYSVKLDVRLLHATGAKSTKSRVSFLVSQNNSEPLFLVAWYPTKLPFGGTLGLHLQIYPSAIYRPTQKRSFYAAAKPHSLTGPMPPKHRVLGEVTLKLRANPSCNAR